MIWSNDIKHLWKRSTSASKRIPRDSWPRSDMLNIFLFPYIEITFRFLEITIRYIEIIFNIIINKKMLFDISK